ncbi:hypothetical protein RFI_33971 [Reticulomyxa filosa]|uniref:Uncharacterized protein n=1 Tax=Reticulomyxa filosa TaxID=46433 RepID=X6LPZ6_RETFI|nr:hypothetical protein RFI_33971 [Reticulomyxa filosa]|eukprot:ETO03436.1 hypothetical protein RFI_33971 [Reticulomyxa filosa]
MTVKKKKIMKKAEIGTEGNEGEVKVPKKRSKKWTRNGEVSSEDGVDLYVNGDDNSHDTDNATEIESEHENGTATATPNANAAANGNDNRDKKKKDKRKEEGEYSEDSKRKRNSLMDKRTSHKVQVKQKVTIEDLETAMRQMIHPMSIQRNNNNNNNNNNNSNKGENEKKQIPSERNGSYSLMSFFFPKKKTEAWSSLELEKNQKKLKEHVTFQSWQTLYDDDKEKEERKATQSQLHETQSLEKTPKKKITILKGLHKSLYEANLPLLVDTPRSERDVVFKEKLRLCRAVCDFNDLVLFFFCLQVDDDDNF